jgi:hypothetical protein
VPIFKCQKLQDAAVIKKERAAADAKIINAAFHHIFASLFIWFKKIRKDH